MNSRNRKARAPVFSRIPIAVRYMSKAHSPVVEVISMGARLVDSDPRRFDANWGLGLRFWPSVDNKPFFLKAWKHVLPMQAHIWWHIYVRILSSLPFVLIRLLDEEPTAVEALVAFLLLKAQKPCCWPRGCKALTRLCGCRATILGGEFREIIEQFAEAIDFSSFDVEVAHAQIRQLLLLLK